MVAVAKFLGEATKNSFVVRNFVAVTKPFFSVYFQGTQTGEQLDGSCDHASPPFFAVTAKYKLQQIDARLEGFVI